jgi:hypothetical protein
VTGFTEYWPLVSGVVIILVVLLMPGGLFGIIKTKGYFASKKVALEGPGPLKAGDGKNG